MDPKYQEVLAEIVKKRQNDKRGIQQQTDFQDVAASFKVLLKEPDQNPPHYAEVQEELEKLGMSKPNAHDVTIVYRTLKFLYHHVP